MTGAASTLSRPSASRLTPAFLVGATLVGVHVIVGLMTLVWTPYDPTAMTIRTSPTWTHGKSSRYCSLWYSIDNFSAFSLLKYQKTPKNTEKIKINVYFAQSHCISLANSV